MLKQAKNNNLAKNKESEFISDFDFESKTETETVAGKHRYIDTSATL